MDSIHRGPGLLGAAIILLVATSCADDDDDAPPPPVIDVTSIEPMFVAFQPGPFTVRGSGFSVGTAAPASISGERTPSEGESPEVVITFHATTGTPFANGTSAVAQVPGTVISDTEIQGDSPVTGVSGSWQCAVEVTAAGSAGTSTAPLAVFAGMTLAGINPERVRADQETPFAVFGFNFLPLNGSATVRFTSMVPGAFPGGSSTLDVQGTVVGRTKISGVTRAFAVTGPVPARVSVILDQEPNALPAEPSDVLLTFLPPPPVPVVVTSITSPLPIGMAMPFTITGSGFLGAGGANVEVTFEATAGTPFFGGTAPVATVLGTATSDTTITGMSPTGTAAADVMAFVTVIRSDGVSGKSVTDIALFTVPVETVGDFAPLLLSIDGGTPFTITGTNLPALPTATVRFRAFSGTPFIGGSETVDVTATITSTTQIDGTSPPATATTEFLAEVTVILPNAELPMGVVCVFVLAGPPPPLLTVTNLDDSGAGSLRDTILNAPAGSILTFDPLLAGTIATTSTIVVPRSMRIFGPADGAIRVQGSLSGPVFTIQTAATTTIVDQLEIFESRHLGDGGAFLVQGGLELDRCRLADNSITGRGGAVFVDANATFAATECAFGTNSSQGKGGTVFVASGATAQVSASSIAESWAATNGGALYVFGSGALSVVNCTFNANVAVNGSGGVAYVETEGTLNLQHCTLAYNVALAGGGGVNVSTLGTLEATNCIFRNMGPSPEIRNAGTNNTTFSLLRDGTDSDLTHGVNGNLVGTSGAPIDPELGLFLLNGGPTKTHALSPTSPALDVGNPSAVSTDQRGEPRPAGAGPDVGAYEATVIL